MVNQMKKSNIFNAIIINLALINLFGCASLEPKPSLYDQLGGISGIHKITNLFINEIGFDPVEIHFFEKANLNRFRQKFAEKICVVSGGPCTYTGESMKLVHEKMHIQPSDFNRIVDHLITAMNKAGVPVPAQNRLIAKLAPMRKDIIYR
jgi:hemoglobin